MNIAHSIVALSIVALSLLICGQCEVRSQTVSPTTNLVSLSKDQLFSSIVDGWKQLEVLESSPHSFKVTINRINGRKREAAAVGVVKKDNKREIFHSNDLVFSKSPWYGFVIRKTDKSQDAWAVQSMYTHEQLTGVEYSDLAKHPLRSLSCVLSPYSLFDLGGLRYSQAAQRRNYQIVRSEQLQAGILLVDFVGVDTKTQQITEKCTMHLHIAKHYCPIYVKRSNVAQPTVYTEQTRTIQSNPLRVTSFTHRLIVSNEVFNETSIELTEHTDSGPTDDEGILSYYGLPEPPGFVPPAKPTPRYVWLLLTAAAFAVISLSARWLLRRLHRRTAAASPTPPTTG